MLTSICRCFYLFAMKFTHFLLLSFALLFAACEDFTPSPKPRTYPRVMYPEKKFQTFRTSYCNFSFEQPAYAEVERDTLFFDEKPASDCWFNLNVPQLNAKIYCSYYPIKNRADFDKLVSDAFFIANKHTVKASYIDPIPVHRDADHVHGLIFDLDGPAASMYQFFLTDSTKHFLRGALYFNTQTRRDSLEEVIEFMKPDLDRIVNTLQWDQ